MRSECRRYAGRLRRGGKLRTTFRVHRCERLLQPYPDFRVKPEDTKVVIDTPDRSSPSVWFIQGLRKPDASSISFLPGCLWPKRGRSSYFVNRLTVANAQALNPNGAADLPPPEGEIFSSSTRLRELSGHYPQSPGHDNDELRKGNRPCRHP